MTRTRVDVEEEAYISDVTDIEADMQGYRESLYRRDRGSFDRLFADAKRQSAAAAGVGPFDPFQLAMFSMILEMKEDIERLKQEVGKRDRLGQ